jgi:phage gp37-like protein
MPGLTIIDLEDALIDRIKAQLSYLKTVESYGGQLEGDLRQLAVRFPAVFVMLGAVRHDAELDAFGGTYGAECIFDLAVCCRNLRGEAAGRRESQGAYQILDGLRQALAGQTLGLAGAQPVEPDKEEALVIERDLVIYRAAYRLGMQWELE